MRAAIYFTPERDHPLTRRAAEWLGRDAFDDRATRAPDATLDPHVGDPARYGFHATLKAPFRLAPGRQLDELSEALALHAPRADDVLLGKLRISRIGHFFALTPEAPSPQLAALEADVCARFDRFRAPLTEAEIAKRRPDELTARQRESLQRWGYPHTGADFRFHMTLTNAIADEAEAEAMSARLHAHFDAVLARPIVLDALSLFVEPQPGWRFQVYARHPLRAPMPLGVLAL